MASSPRPAHRVRGACLARMGWLWRVDYAAVSGTSALYPDRLEWQVQAEPERKRDDMPRNRPAQDYTGRHRIKVAASGQHKQDKLPPPDIPYRPPRTALLSAEETGNWSRWYDPSDLRGIDPDLVSPVPREKSRPTGELPPWLEPKRKIRPRYLIAAVATGLVAVPALLMAGWIANETSNANAATNISSQLSPGTAY